MRVLFNNAPSLSGNKKKKKNNFNIILFLISTHRLSNDRDSKIKSKERSRIF